MRGHSGTKSRVETESHTESNSETMRCISCKEYNGRCDTGTCKECSEEASETKEELKREIEDIKANVAFLHFWSPLNHPITHRSSTSPCFSDVVLVASSSDGLTRTGSSVLVLAHKGKHGLKGEGLVGEVCERFLMGFSAKDHQRRWR